MGQERQGKCDWSCLAQRVNFGVDAQLIIDRPPLAAKIENMARGRPRQFDEQQVLSSAAQLFRERGFVGTSMQALSEAMGMGEQSIYNAFGSKQEVFQHALGHYCSESGQALAALTAPGASRGAVKAFLFAVIDAISGGAPACLVTQTCLTGQELAPEVSAQLSRQMRKVERHFQRAVEQAIQKGEASCDDPKAAARFFNMTLQGLTIMARCGSSRRALRQQVNLAMKVLD